MKILFSKWLEILEALDVLEDNLDKVDSLFDPSQEAHLKGQIIQHERRFELSVSI